MRALSFIAVVLVSAGCSDAPGIVAECSGGAESEPCRVFALVNEERARAGVPAYRYDAQLAIAAQRHAVDMADNGYFSHDSLDGRTFVDRANEAGYDGSPRGENIARGQTSPEQVMTSWMGSEGHRANILSSGSNEIGVGFHQNLWVQVFGRGSEEP